MDIPSELNLIDTIVEKMGPNKQDSAWRAFMQSLPYTGDSRDPFQLFTSTQLC
jgi:hypothetical protein